MLYPKAFHVIFMVTWFAGIFYLPRLFVYHAMASDAISLERFKIMERKLYWGIMTPSAVLTLISGLWLLHDYAWQAYKTQGWLHAKLSLIVLLFIYHGYLYQCLKRFKANQNQRGHVFYRVINEIPVLLLAAIVILVIVKPF